ncbi:Centromere protein C [Phytophthora citrophthora]|uniref:Centromere protein C n=1 Tax=Phytophthora citrophthora TaxID=4793 RepID=A0AAD9H180_9STRA|nr:Centromere protein C [Phytophthora citrophthora]
MALAANDRAQVDRAKLKQYMATKNTPHSVGARSGVVVRGDVRKDAEGFEDVDDFWVDDEDSMQDDSVDDDDSLTASDKEAADTSGDISEPSEHEVELPEIGSPSMSDRESMDIEAGPIPSRSVVRSQRSSGPVAREEKTAEAPPSPARSDVSFDFGGSPHGSVDMNDMNAEANVTMRDRRKKSTGKDTTKSKARRRESFGGFDDDMASPFSLNEGPVTPLSNASDRTLKSIPSYKSSLSPNISKELFKDGDYNSDVSAKKPKKKQTKGKAAKKKSTSGKQSIGDAKTRRIRPTGKYGYRTNPPTTDTSIQSIQTDDDNDESFETQNDSGGETGDDSFYNEPDAPTGPVRDRLPDASKILDGDEDHDAWDGSGLRRSKRRRFKPLAWFKSEHMVYERTFVGVGTVMPTVVGVERLGRDDSPTKRTKAKPPSKRTNNSRAFSLKDLPKDVQKRIVESEWATLYDSQAGCMNDLNIICRSSEIRLRKLPTEERGGAVVHAYAGQSFNLFSPSPFARWISGRVVLPPGAWKEPEGVGQAVQLFYVTGCQPKSLELALAPETDDDFFKSKHTTHFLLSPGDEFYVPSGNVYYVKNHSSTADCDLRFTILKPEAPAMVDDIDVEEKEQPQDVEAESSPLKRKREDGAEADADRDSDSV